MKRILMFGFLIKFSFLMALSNRTQNVDVGVPIAVLLPNVTIGGRCTNEAIEMAVKDVNSVGNFIVHNATDNSTGNTLVTNYKLEPYYAETMETVGDAIEALYSLYENITKISTIGPPFKDQNEYITEYTASKANVHISYSEANEPMEYVSTWHFRTPPSISSSFDAATSLLEEFDWTRTGMLYDYSDFRYRKNVDKLRDIITKKNYQNNTIIAEQGIWSIPIQYSVSKELSVLQDKGVRIILTLVSVKGARKIFCEAYKRNMYQPKVTWILFETLPTDWASNKYNAYKSQREIQCTEEELLTAADGYISITKQGLRSDEKQTISNMTAHDFRLRLQQAVGDDMVCDENVAYAYDAIWVLANCYRNMSKTTELLKYEYNHIGYSDNISSCIQHLNFEALTGPLKYVKINSFRSNRIGQTVLWVNHKLEKGKVFARHDTASNLLELLPDARKIVFKSGIVPKDRAIYMIKNDNFNKALLVVMWILSLFGIGMVIVILGGSMILSRYKYCIFDTPVVDCVLLLGGVLCYLSVIIYSIDSRYVAQSNIPKTCTAFLSVLSIGFTLAFGSLFAKTWKLYKMYMTPEMKVDGNKQQDKKEFPEWLLIAMVTSLVVGDVILLTCWTVTAPFYNRIYNMTSTSNLIENVIEMKQVIRCRCENQTQFTIGIYCYKGLLLIFGLFLAWQTRNAKLKCKTDSKQIAMAIYNVVAVSVIGVICVTVLANTTRHQATFAIISLCIIICTTTTLMLVFLKKIQQVLRGDLSSFKLDNDRSIGNTNECSGTKYTLEYMHKPNESLDLDSRTMSTNTINTQISTESPTTQCESAPESSSIVSVSPTYLHSTSQCIPPPVYSEVDATSTIYIGSISAQ